MIRLDLTKEEIKALKNIKNISREKIQNREVILGFWDINIVSKILFGEDLYPNFKKEMVPTMVQCLEFKSLINYYIDIAILLKPKAKAYYKEYKSCKKSTIEKSGF